MKKPFYLRERRSKTHISFAIPGLLILFGTVGGALAWNLYYSFTRWSGFGTPRWVGFHNYYYLFLNEEVRQTVMHAVFTIIPFSIVPTLLGAFIAAILVEYISPRFGESLASSFRSLLYLPQVVPLAMTGAVWSWILNSKGGLVNRFFEDHHINVRIGWLENVRATEILFALILIWLQLGFTLIIFIAGMSRIDTNVLEAAQLDGASWFQQFRLITLPLLRPEMTVVVLTTTVSSLKIFAPVYWITKGGPYGSTQVPSTYVFNQFYGGSQVGRAAAISSVFAILVGCFAALLMRYQRRNGLVNV